MGLYESLENDLKAALKQSDATKLSVLRMLLAAIKTFEIDKNVKRADEADILQMIRKQMKQRKESIAQFEKGNRKDLADKELKELKILEAYMPKQLSEQELETLVKEVMAETGATSKSDMGKVMKAVTEKAKGRSDGKIVSQIVMKLLH